MGLLDNLDPSTETGQRFLGLLAAAGPQTDPTKTSYAARLKMAEDGVQDWKQNKLMGEYRQAQMDAQKRQLAAQEAQAKQAAVQQEALGKLFNLTGGGGGFSPATDGVFDGSMKYTQPTPQKLQLNQQAVLEAARLGVDPKRLQEYADLQNIGMAEVARTIDGRDSDGRPVTYQKDKYGRDVASPVAQWKAPEYRDTGGAITAIDTITNKPILQLPKTQSPDSKASNALGWANHSLAKQKADQETANGGYSAKPLPAAALKMQSEAVDAINTASGINSQLDSVAKQIEGGKLDFGPVSNAVSGARNWAGMSNEQSRNLASFRSTIEKLRNDSLRLNTGVQTDGDAQRAWNELFTNINDTDLVKQRLIEIQGINKRAEQLQRMRVDQIRGNYNLAPMEINTATKPAAGAYQDPAKEARYQAWLQQQKGR